MLALRSSGRSEEVDKILQIFKRPELRNKVLFIFFLLAIFRLVSNIPIPAIDASRLRDFLAQNQLFGLISSFTGGSLSSLSIGMLGLGPYITGSIIMQLLTMIFPSLEQMYKYEGEAGRMKFNQYSRLLTVPLAALQGYGFLVLLSRQGVIGTMDPMSWVGAISVIVAGSVFFMWLGELITEKNLGNG
ncbi:MAG: preprotein translocase subunit SecY, partial [bacterium]|nr:preprotein translocase subunit SecY [bacterium]